MSSPIEARDLMAEILRDLFAEYDHLSLRTVDYGVNWKTTPHRIVTSGYNLLSYVRLYFGGDDVYLTTHRDHQGYGGGISVLYPLVAGSPDHEAMLAPEFRRQLVEAIERQCVQLGEVHS